MLLKIWAEQMRQIRETVLESEQDIETLDSYLLVFKMYFERLMSDLAANKNRSNLLPQPPAPALPQAGPINVRKYGKRKAAKKPEVEVAEQEVTEQEKAVTKEVLQVAPSKLTCKECGSTFAKLKQVNAHVKRVHGKKPFACTLGVKKVCTQRFAYEGDLHRHAQQTHLYCHKCQIYAKNWGDHLFMHEAKTHVDKGEKYSLDLWASAETMAKLKAAKEREPFTEQAISLSGGFMKRSKKLKFDFNNMKE